MSQPPTRSRKSGHAKTVVETEHDGSAGGHVRPSQSRALSGAADFPIREVALPPRSGWRVKPKARASRAGNAPLSLVAGLDNAGGVPAVATPVSFVETNGEVVALYAVPGDAVPTDSISDHGGARVVRSTLELVFWGSAWQTATAPSASNIVTAVQTLLGGAYLTQLAQYSFQNIALRGATIFTSPNPPNTFTTANVGNVIWNAIDQGIFPEPDDAGGRMVYIVLMPSGTNGPATARGAHTDPSDYDFPFDIDYAWVGWVGPGTIDYTTDVLSHELAEAITDPEPNAPAWLMSRTINGGNEIGDACNNTVDRVDNLLLQAYWSQQHHACVLPFGPPPLPASSGEVAAVSRTTQQLDVFWTAPDGSVWSTWWNQTANNGQWNAPFIIAGPGSATGLVAACSRTPQHLDVFWVAPDGSVRSAWWDQNANNAAWNAPFTIAGPGAALGGIVAVSRFAQHVDVFWTQIDGSIWSAWWDQNLNNSSWNAPFSIAGPGSALGHGALAATCRTPRHLDVFWIALDGSVWSAWWDQNANNGVWNAPFSIAGSGSAVGGVAAVGRTPQHLDIFWVVPNGAIASAWWDQNANGGAWNPAFTISGPGIATARGPTALARTPQHLDAFWVAPDGSGWSAWWDQNANGAAWNAPFALTPPGLAGLGSVAATSRTSTHVDVFWSGPDGSVDSAWWDQAVNGGFWNGSFSVASAGLSAGGVPALGIASSAATGRIPYHLDLFWPAPDGSVWSAWWDENANGGAWNAKFPIAAPLDAAAGEIHAVSRLSQHLDIFWRGEDGTVRSAWWDSLANNGDWNPPFTIAGSGSAAGPIAAVGRLPRHLDIFWTAPDGSVQSAWWDADADAPWSAPFVIAGQGSAAGTVTAVSRLPYHIDAFWTAPDGSISSAFWDQNGNNGVWGGAFPIAGPSAAGVHHIAAVARLPYHLDLFWTGPDGSVRSAWWDQNANNGAWQPFFTIAGAGAGKGPVSAVARKPYHLDVFWAAPDGSVWSAWWDQNATPDAWGAPYLIAGPGSASAKGVWCVAREPNHLDIFWIAPDGSVWGSWWDLNVNSGNWNAPFPIAPAGSA